jgi:ParB-like chromosome segregation protein Spo0J
VRPDIENGGFVLIAGHKRYAALEQLGQSEIRAEVRPDGEGEACERAAENLVRSPLNPYEPGTIALDASFAGRGDAAGCGFGAFQG